MESSAKIVIWLATFFAMLSPFIFVRIRESVKIQRQEVITDLAKVFDVSKDSTKNLIPSFEFVKYKYFVGPQKRRNNLSSELDDGRAALISTEIRRHRADHSRINWIIGSSAFSALAGIGMLYTLSLLVSLLSNASPNPFRWPETAYVDRNSVEFVWLLGASAAFVAAYITAVRNLYKATKNFDLSPQTIVGETIKVLVGVTLVPIISIALVPIATTPPRWLVKAVSEHIVSIPAVDPIPNVLMLVVGACFIAGLMPDVVLRSIIQRNKLKNFKREEGSVYDAFRITPVEIIDGIDSDIRIRLDDHHIHSTQNLAAANPLMLFVETPFGVYQIMDWVAQAQLCCSVGRDKIVRLWPLGVRTLFDLERLGRATNTHNQALLLEVGRIILGDTVIPQDIPVASRADAVALVKTSIDLRLDDPHVQRLRQIYIAVGDRLGEGSRRFRWNACGYRVIYRFRNRRSDAANARAGRCRFRFA